jgi:hypothetical protein
VDPHLLKVIRQETSETLGKTRGALKPLERILTKQEPSVLYLYETVQKSGDSLYKTMVRCMKKITSDLVFSKIGQIVCNITRYIKKT